MTPEIVGDILLRPAKRLACVHVYHLLARVLAADVPGDVVELGCRIGDTSRLIRRTLDLHGTRPFHVYDSFEGGFQPPSAEDAGHDADCLMGGFREPQSEFEQRFAEQELELPTIHAGWFRNTLGDLPDTVAFAYLDSDLHDAIAESLEAVYHRLARGAICLIDDCGGYVDGWSEKFPGVGIAVRRFLQGVPESAVPLWTGTEPQAYFVKA